MYVPTVSCRKTRQDKDKTKSDHTRRHCCTLTIPLFLKATGTVPDPSHDKSPWGIVSIKAQVEVYADNTSCVRVCMCVCGYKMALSRYFFHEIATRTVQDVDGEIPMEPITILRNALGR
jgi:hypothetical protein